MMRKCAWVAAVLLAAFLGGMCSQWMQSRMAVAADDAAAGKAKAASAAQTVTVGKLVLVDADGKERAVLSAEGEKTLFSMYDEKGRKRVVIGSFPVQDNIPYWGLLALDLEGKRRFVSGVHGDGSGAGEGIYSPTEAIRYGLGFMSDGNGGMTINDPDGKQRWGMGMPANAGVSMAFKDANGNIVEGLQKPPSPPGAPVTATVGVEPPK